MHEGFMRENVLNNLLIKKTQTNKQTIIYTSFLSEITIFENY